MMLHPVDATGRKITPANKIYYTDSVPDGTYYYALTSEEHSGLESNELSEIVRVVVSGGAITSQTIVSGKGQKDFWRVEPTPVSNFNYSATGTSGHYRLTWGEPSDSKIRYYNIYYSTSGNPARSQKNRIASVPVGTSTYLDWLADTSNDGYYGITSVDRYGNEGDIVYSAWLGSMEVSLDKGLNIFGKIINFFKGILTGKTVNAITGNVVIGDEVYEETRNSSSFSVLYREFHSLFPLFYEILCLSNCK